MIYKPIDLPQESAIQDVFRHIASDVDRTAAIASGIIVAFDQGRKVLVLTECTEHLDAILLALDDKLPPPFVLHGRMSKKQRAAQIIEIERLQADALRVLLATRKLVG